MADDPTHKPADPPLDLSQPTTAQGKEVILLTPEMVHQVSHHLLVSIGLSLLVLLENTTFPPEKRPIQEAALGELSANLQPWLKAAPQMIEVGPQVRES